MYLKAYIQNLVKNGHVVSEKSKFQFSYVNDLDFENSHTFINSISCLHLRTYRSQCEIVSENPLFSLFPIKKPKLQNLTLLKNMASR